MFGIRTLTFMTHSALLTPPTDVRDPENKLGDAGAGALVDAIKDIKGLQKLDLRSECI